MYQSCEDESEGWSLGSETTFDIQGMQNQPRPIHHLASDHCALSPVMCESRLSHHGYFQYDERKS